MFWLIYSSAIFKGFMLLYTLPMNINRYDPFLINMLDMLRVKIYKVVTTSNSYLLHTAGKYCILLIL